LLNLLLGWTLFGWVASIVWASAGAGTVISKATPGTTTTKLKVVNEKTCPFCAEEIKLQATICRFCNREQPKIEEDRVQEITRKLEGFLPLSEFATKKNIEESKVIPMIRDGFYNGRIVEDKWYVHESEL
jgi:hypothetical protein